MKKFIRMIVVALAMAVAVPSFALAADKLLDTKISTLTVAVDKNGNEYVRMIVNEDRKIQGVSYTVGVPVMAFGTAAAKAKSLKAGDKLKAIVAAREYRGETSYTVRTFLASK